MTRSCSRRWPPPDGDFTRGLAAKPAGEATEKPIGSNWGTHMGAKYEATCRDCSHTFRASDGGGFQFFKLHCWACGQVKNVSHLELIPEATEQYRQTTHEAVEATGHSN